MNDEEAAWRAISDAEEALRTQEARAVQYEPDDMSIPEVFITRLMERGMLTREQAGELAVEWLGSPEGIMHNLHVIFAHVIFAPPAGAGSGCGARSHRQLTVHLPHLPQEYCCGVGGGGEPVLTHTLRRSSPSPFQSPRGSGRCRTARPATCPPRTGPLLPEASQPHESSWHAPRARRALLHSCRPAYRGIPGHTGIVLRIAYPDPRE